MTITIDNNFINQNYTQYEIQAKFENFLVEENLDDKVELFEISFDDVSEKTKNRFNNIKFVNYEFWNFLIDFLEKRGLWKQYKKVKSKK